MEAIEYLKGKENKELNDVIILIIKEFLGIIEKEAIAKVKSVIQTGKAYCEFEKLVTNQKSPRSKLARLIHMMFVEINLNEIQALLYLLY